MKWMKIVIIPKNKGICEAETSEGFEDMLVDLSQSNGIWNIIALVVIF